MLGVITEVESTKAIEVYEMRPAEETIYVPFSGFPEDFTPGSQDQISITVSKSGVISIQLRNSGEEASLETREVRPNMSHPFTDINFEINTFLFPIGTQNLS